MVQFHDPYVDSVELSGDRLRSVDLAEALPTADCVVVVTDHSTIDWDLVASRAPCIVDTRNALRGRAVVGRLWRL